MKKKKIFKRLKRVGEDHLRKLTPHPHLRNHQQICFPVQNHLHLMFLIEDLIKVSVMALNGIERGGDRPLKEPERGISEVLKHALDLLPLEEAEFIDKITEILNQQETKD
ncbi:MAG TPA: hypothetical protein DCM10_15330 [Xanthomarina gelatinilytica]|uniref:hypothetical protein n=1 Tax=Leeuwenhoekiella TaxID=283735 RepID=UPI000C46F5BD|nr:MULTISPECIES: hypothetical protein [Leeuwenhoekiella]MAO45168.1 hypothetical protein [Leeuwenhoekiella sp.]MBQ51203.1 hypothetical protein [Leeuwenhoekiella sp.]HAB27381.1 hypothetical protein [Xanthomarina gelatinilytica]HAI19273.1 hypothetical protein [Xanthomarina gelatinilytica]|tara:strand:- start:184 stop:513 length:330 start_codon:yes stop_codon:yes gene_type:complete